LNYADNTVTGLKTEKLKNQGIVRKYQGKSEWREGVAVEPTQGFSAPYWV